MDETIHMDQLILDLSDSCVRSLFLKYQLFSTLFYANPINSLFQTLIYKTKIKDEKVLFVRFIIVEK